MTRYTKQNLIPGATVKIVADRDTLAKIGITMFTDAKYVFGEKIRNVGTEYWFQEYPNHEWCKIRRKKENFPFYQIPIFMIEVCND